LDESINWFGGKYPTKVCKFSGIGIGCFPN
jgi:hypothetical protein